MHPSASVRVRVLEATRALVLVRVVEALALGATAGGACFAAALLSGPIETGAAITVAVIGAAAAGLTWWCEHAPSTADVARRIDRVEDLDGALVTAYEHERDASPLAALLARRVGATLTRGAGLRAVMPRSAAVFALPLAGAGAILLALEVRRVAPDRVGHVPRVEALVAALEGLGREAGVENSASGSAALGPVVAAAAEVRAALAAPRRGALEPALRELDARVADALVTTRDPRLGQAQSELASLRGELEVEHATDRTSSVPEGATTVDSPGSGPATPVSALTGPETPAVSPGPESSSSGASELAGGSREGTMPGRGTSLAKADETMTTTTQDEAPRGETRSETGVRGARWWPERYDEVVARWIEDRAGRSE